MSTNLSLQKITKEYEDNLVLNEVSFAISTHEKIALVGNNGSGKSTLLKIIAGEEESDTGSVSLQPGNTIGYFPQITSSTSVGHDFIGWNELSSAQRSKVAQLEKELSLPNHWSETEVKLLSGGEKAKLSLIKLLFSTATIYLLDEPTNNLDFASQDYLHSFIQNSQASFIIVSHDRDFLDTHVTKVYELDEHTHSLQAYDGNYTAYKEQKSSLADKALTEMNSQRKKEKSLKHDLDQFQRGANEVRDDFTVADNDKLVRKGKIEGAQEVYGSLRRRDNARLEKLQGEIEKPAFTHLPKVVFGYELKSPQKVLALEGLSISRKDTGFETNSISAQVVKGERIHITGKNGSGKTTLINTLLAPFSGSDAKNTDSNTVISGHFVWSNDIKIGYIPQNLLEDITGTILEVFENKSGVENTEARTQLARLGIRDNKVFENITEVSPGTQSRILIAAIAASQPNVLILDEPTNHLDFTVLEELEAALGEYTGTILFTSHDKRFTQKLNPQKFIAL